MAEKKSAERYAIIQAGGKQYQAVEGKTLALEKIEGDIGSPVEFKEVLLRKTGKDKVEIGRPYLEAPVKASILKHIKGPKVIAYTFKRRKKVRIKKGHRQPGTVVRIEAI